MAHSHPTIFVSGFVSMQMLHMPAFADQPRAVASFPLPHASFVAVMPGDDSRPGGGDNAGLGLIMTTFQAIGHGTVVWQGGIGAVFNGSALPDAVVLNSGLSWPNQVTYSAAAPDGPLATPALLVGDGFLVPGKSTGSVYALPLAATGSLPDAASPVALAPRKDGYFYHRAVWIDMDGDGVDDILTARATKPIFGPSGGELVWLRNPGGRNPLAVAPWPLTVITSHGCDVEFAIDAHAAAPGSIHVFCASFFAKQLTLNVVSTSNASLLHHLVIDSGLPLESITVVDVNGDGLLDLLTNTHTDVSADSAVLAYEFPADVLSGSWPKHVVASGFNTTERSPGPQASPGFTYAAHVSTTAKRPTVLIAGDGAQAAFQAAPMGPPSSWAFELSTILAVDGVVGSLAVADMNGDGWLDLAVPDYDHGVVHLLTYADQL
ncbi:uncharacterized protein AMSG_07146 [Thecamonas trahens ATCC 50062]|uniref:VCBS repeat-containing protein n=1 Tax=Thecamonas trahens ATCC 50062 TaxID=461836 RepID=A0A0L0DEZ0_THETB|nr:hypothetical protein AMSG_07146 [Thecamonas trahens ATCC 50062]KNC50907.1 hypothetical protein AMSG_07146 [Thecamonas trahens ATCC 50062]|eukprot:XP_013756609.1 hypothetical protein AMSG_07146 [Thecamonas trahens ATCC 50062]